MFRPLVSLIALLGFTVTSVEAEEPPPAAALPLEKIPRDAALVLSVEVPKVWHHPILTTLRTVVPRFANEIGADEFRKAFGVDLGDLQHLVVYWQNLKQPTDLQRPVLLMRTRQPYAQAQVRRWADQKAEKSPVEGLVPFNEIALVDFIDPTTLAWVPRGFGKQYINPPQTSAQGPQAPTIDRIGKHTLVAGMYLDRFPDELRSDALPDEVRPYKSLLLAEMVLVHWDLSMPVKIRGQSHFFFTEKYNAADAERSLRLLRELALQSIQDAQAERKRRGRDDPGEAAVLEFVARVIKTVEIEREGLAVRGRVSTELKLETVAKVAMGLLNEVGSVRLAAQRSQVQNNLKQIALAMLNYESAHGFFPVPMTVDRSGKPLLSWRVAILPYIEQDNLYRQFKLDEPWDSEHNKKLLDKMPQVYATPGLTPEGGTDTHFQLFVGGGAVFDKLLPTRIRSITDGTSNSIMVAQAAKAVPWTKPDDLDFDPNGPLPELLFLNGISNVAFCDGSVRALQKSIEPKVLKALITRSGGEVINLNP